MNNIEIIHSLNKIALELDRNGNYRESEEIDRLIKTAIKDAPRLRRNNPDARDIRRKYLEQLPPQNILESAYQFVTGKPGAVPPTIKIPGLGIDESTPESFFNHVLGDFRVNERISEDFINLLFQSPRFITLFSKFLSKNNRQVDVAKEMLEKAEPYLIDKLEREFKKHKILVGYGSIHIDFQRVLEELLSLRELLPSNFLSQADATKEWVDYQRQQEIQALHYKYDTLRDDHRAPERARKELDEYLEYRSGEPSAIERAQQKRQEETQTLRNSNIINKIYKIANTLDNSGYHKEATSLTNVMKRLAGEETTEQEAQRLHDELKSDAANLPKF